MQILDFKFFTVFSVNNFFTLTFFSPYVFQYLFLYTPDILIRLNVHSLTCHVVKTGSRPITEVKQRRAWLVVGWVTAAKKYLLAQFKLEFLDIRT
jgi:ATP-dependent Clp protease adapter protein ClpS